MVKEAESDMKRLVYADNSYLVERQLTKIWKYRYFRK